MILYVIVFTLKLGDQMKRFTFTLLALALVMVALVATPTKVNAYADATNVALSCDTFSASGTTDQPYVTIYVYNWATSDEYFIVVAANGGHYSGTLTFPGVPAGTFLNYEVWGSPNTYVHFGDPGYWDNDSYYNKDINCTAGFSGRGIPAGFVQHVISCDVAVFNGPGGTPVGENRIRAGQVWFVNPAAVNAADGKSWTEIFVSGTLNGWIPTSCVQ
jgi:hypothetical protein